MPEMASMHSRPHSLNPALDNGRPLVPNAAPISARAQPAGSNTGLSRSIGDHVRVVDWGAGEYERTAAELEPVAAVVIDQAAISPGEAVLDLACGTGNAALLAAVRGARVIGVDGSSRLLEVGRRRSAAQGVEIDYRLGDLVALPIGDREVDAVVSVFGLIYAPDPAAGLREVRRVLTSAGRVLFTAWVPAGPIDAMLASTGQIIARITGAHRPPRFRWSDAGVVASVAAEAGLELRHTTAAQLAIRESSVEAYVAATRTHPAALASLPLLARAGAEAEALDAMTAILREANEDPQGFLVHTPYVIHELRRG